MRKRDGGVENEGEGWGEWRMRDVGVEKEDKGWGSGE